MTGVRSGWEASVLIRAMMCWVGLGELICRSACGSAKRTVSGSAKRTVSAAYRSAEWVRAGEAEARR